VIVSYYEWVQAQQKLAWTLPEVVDRLERQLHAAIDDVMVTAERLDVPLRPAAQSLAIARAAEAARLRGVYP
jgi:glutamate dehydrogenase/leucine dehydrogenase